MSPATAERLAEVRATTDAKITVVYEFDDGCFVIVAPYDATPSFLMRIEPALCYDKRVH